MLDYHDHDHAREPVPTGEGVGGWHIGLIYIGMGLALPAFLVGTQIGTALGLGATILAIVLSGLILTAVGATTGAIGAKVRLSTYMITQITFGRLGANIVNLLIACAIAGWFGVIVHMFASSLNSLFIEQFSLDFGITVWSIFGGILMVSTAVWGFQGLDKLSLLAVPLLFGLLIVTNWHILAETTLSHVLSVPGSGTISFGVAVSMMASGFIGGAAIMPDISRYGKTTKDGAIGAMLCFLPGMTVVLTLSAIPAIAIGELDIVKVMTGFGWPIASTLVVIMAAWTSNDNNLYSASLGVASVVRNAEKWRITIVIGSVGTLLAVLGIMEKFIPFLNVVGVVTAPMAGTYIADYFVRKAEYERADVDSAPAFRPVALISWAVGSLVALCTLPEAAGGQGIIELTTVSALDGLLAGMITLWIFSHGFISSRRA
uniref:Cytosine permease n=1 Tax=Candidatus Kentrum sp. FW TaxID=2126338 RepID=A0A450S817_9GAMM|nr:MAG: cytosine permease [Candidatus Kentron sp. FW]